MGIVIKPMETDEEIRGKGYVHYKSWQETYSGLIDAEYLKRHTLERSVERAFQWRDGVLVAKDGERVVGFAAYGASRDSDLPGAGEIYALYVLGEYQGQGVGRTLLEAALQRLAARDTAALWVLKGNERAQGFYRRMGFAPDKEAAIQMGGPNVVVRMLLRR